MFGVQGTYNNTYRQLMGNGMRYVIPKFQRDYSWEKEHWDELWNDILALQSNEESAHYLGYLVLQSTDNKNFDIIDGQQRLTTLSIIVLTVLKALKDLVENNIEPNENQIRIDTLLSSYIGYVNPATLISNNKMRLNRNSDDYYRSYMVLLKELPLRNINASEKQMRDCFVWYYEKIKSIYKTGESLAGLIENIVDKLFFTVINVND